MYHRPVCVKCQTEMRPETNGIGLLDMATFGPYKVWDADLYKCPSCGQEIVTGFGEGAVSHHIDEDFNQILEGYRSRTGLYINSP